MFPLKSIIVGYDFSPCADVAVARALAFAVANGATLRVVHVIDGLVIADLADAAGEKPEVHARQATTHARAALDAAIDRIVADGPRPAELVATVTIGAPIDELLSQVRSHEPDLLVLGAYGAGGADGRPGTLAGQCARKAPTRVLLVDESAPSALTNIVACVDFSETSREALRHAVRIAARHRGHLHALHVFAGPWHRLHYRAPTPEASPDFRRQYTAALQGRLEQFVQGFASEAQGATVHLELRDRPSYGPAIVTFARDVGADLVVLGTRGRTNLRYLLLGSTAERVLRDVTCSVLAIKPVS